MSENYTIVKTTCYTLCIIIIIMIHTDDVIEEFQDLIQAVKDVGDWRALCLNLKVEI